MLAWASQARGQAWVPPPNTLDLDVGYQFIDNDGGYGGVVEGSYELQNEGIDAHQGHSFKLGAGYSTPIEGLAVDAGIAFINTKFTGDPAYSPHGAQHTCTGTPGVDQVCTYDELGTELTDGTLDVRYELPVHPVGIAITPLVGGTVPLSDYPMVGHAAYGKHRKEARVGLEIGRTFLDRKLFVDALYTYSFVERLHECVIAPASSPIAGMCVPDTLEAAESFNLNRSDVRVVGGWFVMPQLSVYGAGVGRRVHNNFRTGDLIPIRAKRMAMEPLTPEETVMLSWHDVLGGERFVAVGGGVNYQPINALTVQTGVYKLVWGDFAPNALAASVSLTWTVF